MIPKNFNGLYIINERTIVTIDLFTYPNILLNKRDFLSSGFVLIGTDVIAILVLPAWTIVSSVCTKDTTFMPFPLLFHFPCCPKAFSEQASCFLHKLP